MTLGYRHGFHAGNAADVFKHALLAHAMSAFVRASATRAVHYIDTHSGSGRYDLTHDFARKLGRWRHGVGRVWGRTDYPDAMSAYVQAVLTCNNATSWNSMPDGPRYYPGSPYIVNVLRRAAQGDTMALHDLHSTEAGFLQHAFGAQRGVTVQNTDGFDVLNARHLPPKGDAGARGIVLLDPAYELASDYTRVMDSFERGVSAWRRGSMFAVWYPLLSAPVKRQAFEQMVARWHTQTTRVLSAPEVISTPGAGNKVSRDFVPGALYRVELATYRAPAGTLVPAGARTDAYAGFKAAHAPLSGGARSIGGAATAVADSAPSAERSSDGTPGIYGSGLLIATPAHGGAASASGGAFWPNESIVLRQWNDIASYCWTLLSSQSGKSGSKRDGYYLVQRISPPHAAAAAAAGAGVATKATTSA